MWPSFDKSGMETAVLGVTYVIAFVTLSGVINAQVQNCRFELLQSAAC